MDTARLTALLARYHRNECSPEEERELLSWYHRLDVNGLSYEEWLATEGSEAALAERLFSDFQRRAEREAKEPENKPLWPWTRIAASFVGIACLLGAGYWLAGRQQGADPLVRIELPANATEPRFVLLPDSSKAVLQPGTSLEYYEPEGALRQVEITGEAYFAVKPDAQRPFSVEAGEVKVTVLGTAFNVKSDAARNSSEVVVNHGKVSVEQSGKMLGVLLANEKLVITADGQDAVQKAVTPAGEQPWNDLVMRFDSVSFGMIAERLQRRYGTNILFTTKSLERCPVTATFTGEETLTDVLDIITTTRGATYRKEESGIGITIDGEGCKN